MVFGGRTEEGDSTDINLFNGVGQGASGLRDGFGKRV